MEGVFIDPMGGVVACGGDLLANHEEVEMDHDEVEMDPRRFLMGPFQLKDTPSTMITPTDATVDDDSTDANTTTVTTTTTTYEAADTSTYTPDNMTINTPVAAPNYTQNKRPRRAAAILAEQRVNDVLRWEQCKESSTMFKNAATCINAEFDRVGRGGAHRSGVVVNLSMSTFVEDESNIDDSHVDDSHVDDSHVDDSHVDNSKVDDSKIDDSHVASDDEGVADVDCPDVDMHNDNDDDLENDEDETGSLASFVMSDSYVSDVGHVSDPESVDNESGVDSDSDDSFSCSGSDSDDCNSDQGKWGDAEKP
jgi:hypothetical protein